MCIRRHSPLLRAARWTIRRLSSRGHYRQAARALRPCPAAQPRTRQTEICCGSSRLCRCPEHRSADRFSACEHAWRSWGTCAAAQLADGDKSVAARCSFCCRMRHRHLGGEGRNPGRQSSSAVADRRRWTDCRSLRSHRLALWARIFPLRTKGRRGFPRRKLYQPRCFGTPLWDDFGCPDEVQVGSSVSLMQTAFVTNPVTLLQHVAGVSTYFAAITAVPMISAVCLKVRETYLRFPTELLAK
jgi:hypothetical protein